MNKPVVLEMDCSLHRGPVVECGGGGGACLPGTLKWSIFLNGSSLRQAWSEGSFAWDPERCIKEGSKRTVVFLGALLGKL
jgi:hypothetical protein